MIFNKENMLRILTLIAIVTFVIISCFVCFEIISVPIAAVNDPFDGPSRYEGYNNNIILSIIFAISQCAFLFIRKKWAKIVSVCIATMSAILTVGRVIDCVLSCVNQPMGGLYSLDFQITIFGYLALFLSFFNIFIQVYSLVKCKQRSENNAAYTYSVSD